MAALRTAADCIFCKIIKGQLPSYKLLESPELFSFLSIGPLSRGHALIIPKFHAQKVHDVPDEYLRDLIPMAKKIAIAQGVEDYNILQNNGQIAHQAVNHVHFHVIPKPSAEVGLMLTWKEDEAEKAELQKAFEEITLKLKLNGHIE